MAKTFKKMKPDKTNLLIIDGLNLSFRWKHSGKKNFAVEYLQTIMSFAQSYTAKRVVVLNDFKGSYYRIGLHPGYKEDRKLKRLDQTEKEKQDFEEFLNDWLVAYELCGTEYTTIQYEGVEADDIAAYLATNKEILENFGHIWCLSTDKDWDLLITDQVSRFSYKTRKETTVDNWNEHYSYEPEDHISVKVLQGDKGDSVPGIPGVGEKRAADLVRDYGSAYDILAQLPIDDKRVFMQNLNKFADQIILNYELMDLVDFAETAIGDNIGDLQNKIGELIKE